MSDLHDIPESYFDDLVTSLIEKRIGSGSARDVYAILRMPYVLKLEKAGSFQNVMEWEMWKEAKGTPMEKWLAPCVSISTSGRALVQHRTAPACGRAYPDKIPTIFCDSKTQNWGVINDRFVCHDYGYNYAIERGIKGIRMKKAPWWDDLTRCTRDGKPIS